VKVVRFRPKHDLIIVKGRLRGPLITVMRSAVGREHGYMIRVERFECLGHQMRDFLANAQDLPQGYALGEAAGAAASERSTRLPMRSGRTLLRAC
jgi:hypothetical protein